ncbi:hypothetical protein [Nonomuraea lactucae]|uniref:hypothetical protein n=1 Tax=Nonomuraea lactucae TaxID=2249762 RepID=UPI000DE53A33|nr:hypothetical protein [Nonomuraea lactucae]
MVAWEPHNPRRGRLRVTETSCCGAYEWACQGGQYMVLRKSGTEEAGRGPYRRARELWEDLVEEHDRGHTLAFPRRWIDRFPTE